MPIFSRVFSGRLDLDEEESRKQIFVLIAVMIGFPFLFTWGIVDFLNDKFITSSLDFAIGTFLFTIFFC